MARERIIVVFGGDGVFGLSYSIERVKVCCNSMLYSTSGSSGVRMTGEQENFCVSNSGVANEDKQYLLGVLDPELLHPEGGVAK